MAMNFDTRYSDVSTGDELRLSDYLAAVLGNWKLVTVIMLAVIALGTAYAFLAPPTYRADALIQVEESNNNNNNNNANANAVQTVSQMFDAKSTTAAQIELLRSRLVVEDAVRRMHLDITASPRYFPFVGGLISSAFSALNKPMPAGYCRASPGATNRSKCRCSIRRRNSTTRRSRSSPAKTAATC
jgi:tyrosine-protein kinase Etk/Wzc